MNNKWRARLACLIMCGVLLLSHGAQAAGFTVSSSVSPQAALPGEEVNVTVTLTASGGAIRGLQTVISVPEGLAFISQNTPAGWTDFAGGASILAVTGGSLQSGDSVAFDVLFKVNEGVTEQQQITLSNARAASAAAESLGGSLSQDSLTIVIGEVSVLHGDANNDGSVDMKDLMSVIKYIVQGTESQSMDNADANNDGIVDMKDLMRIIKHIVEVG